MSKIRVLLKSFDYKLIDNVVEEIYSKVKKMVKGKISGPIPMRTRKTMVTVNRSPHIDRKSKEAFIKKVHVRLIEFPISNVVTNELAKMDFAAGVDIDVKVIEKQSEKSI